MSRRIQYSVSSLAFLMLFLTLCTTGFGQNFLINEDFSSASDTTPPSTWENVHVSGNANFDKFNFSLSRYNFAKPFEGGYAIFDAYNGGGTGGTADNSLGEMAVLISPEVNTNGLSNLSLTFNKMLFLQASVGVYVDVTTNAGGTWTNVWSHSTPIVDGVPTEIKITLDSYTGQSNFQFRFSWINSSTLDYRGYFAIDQVRLFETKSNDVKVSEIVKMYNNSCPSAAQSLEVEIQNVGLNTQSSVPVVLKIGSTTLYDTIYNLKSGEIASAFTSQTFNTSAGGSFTLTAFTQLSSDQVPDNDTLISVRVASPSAKNPNAKNVIQCGTGSAFLIADKNSGDSTYWFASASGGLDLGSGSPFTTSVLTNTTTFYVENARVSQNSLSTGAGLYRFNTSTNGPGSMFDIIASNEVILDSLAQHFAYAGAYKMDVYYRIGTYVGNVTSSSGWIRLDLVTDTVYSAGYGDFVTIQLKKGLRIPAGSTYGFYVDTDVPSITFTNGALTNTNADIKLVGSTVLTDNFNGVLTGYHWNGSLFYRKSCSTNRQAVKVTVKPRPNGTKFLEGASFDGQFRSGSLGHYDIIAETKSVTYDLSPPNPHSNADYGTKWYITGLTIDTKNGTPVGVNDTSTVEPGATNGSLTYTAPSGWADSTIRITISVYDPALDCDSTLTRYLYIAPTPVVDIVASSVCKGVPLQFKTNASISKGTISYLWDFGDGQTSPYQNPYHEYKSHGTFLVRLTVTSNEGIVKDTTINFLIYEIPDIKFIAEHACEGVDIQFTNSTTISTGTLSYGWDFGDGATSKLTSPTHRYTKPGSYKTTLTASANGCTNTLTKISNQFAKPTSNFTAPNGCSGTPIQFINLSTIAFNEKIGSRWKFGSNGLSTLVHPQLTFTTPGKTDIKLISVSQFGCMDSITKSIEVLPGPTAAFIYDKACSIDPVQFTNTSVVPAGVNPIYQWNFGAGATSTAKNPSHKFDLGERYITLKVLGNNGCSDMTFRTIHVLLQPDADFEVDNVCSGQEASFRNKSSVPWGTVEYIWYFGDGDSSLSSVPLKSYNVSETTVFFVSLVAQARDGCSDLAKKTISVEQTPVCGFSSEQSKQDRRTFTFTPVEQGYPESAYTWI
ncbi:MAG: PKD repeat protein, partial [Bacteroidia bacterium]